MARPERHLVPVETIEDTLYPSMSVVASGVRYPGKAPRIFVPPKPWQLEAYRHYGICGEARFAANWIANSLSRVRLFAVNSLTDKTELKNGPAVEALAELFSGADGQSQMMHALGLHLTIAGEAYLVGRTVDKVGDVWEVLAVTEVKANGQSWSITDREQEGKADIALGDDDVVIRVWRPHPEKRREADSPFRSLLPVLSEIEWITRHIFSQLTSRLAGAGLLFVSDGVQIAVQEHSEDPDKVAATQNTATALMQALATAMMRPLQQSGAPESLVPLVMTVPEDLMKSGKIAELMHFWSDLDAEAQTMRNGAIARFADGMDLPAEKIKGMSQSASTGGGRSTGPNHWGMWQIDEEAITLHVEPLAELICNFVTVGYLRPLPDVEEANPITACWYDTSTLRLRPDRSKEAIELYNLGLIKGAVVVRENRFDPDTDMMEDDERETWLLVKIATGMAAATPDQIAAALKFLGVDVPDGTASGAQARFPQQPPSLIDHPTRDLPEAASLLLHVCEPIVLRALERAGNRIRQGGQKPPVPAYLTHTVIAANGSSAKVLEDAFTGTAEVCLAGIADHLKVIPVLEQYVTTLITEQKPHERERLAEWLSLAELV